MTRILSAVVAMLIVGVCGLSMTGRGAAQESRIIEPPRIGPFESEEREALDRAAVQEARKRLEYRLEAPEGIRQWVVESGEPQAIAGRGQPGTWTVVDTKAGTMLLNTGSGASYLLRDADTAPRWVKIQSPKADTLKFDLSLPKLETLILPERDNSDLDQLREQLTKINEDIKVVREQWQKSQDREERRKLGTMLDELEVKLATLKDRVAKLEANSKSKR